MTNDDILDLIRRCNIRDGEELIPGNAYLFNKKFRRNANGRITYEQEELIVLVKNGIKVGGIYRMGSYDIHVVMDERFEGQHIMSDFLRTGIINDIWPENTSVELCGVYTREEFDKKKHLAKLCNMTVRNEEKIEKFLSYCDEQKRKHYS